MTCEKIFLEQLHKRGFRLTPQRETILSTMHHLRGTATADEILARVHQQSEAVDISTVYRTLDLLQSFDLVISLDTGDGQRRYKLVGIEGPHLHLVCGRCGKVMGVDLGPVRAWAAYLLEHHGFEVDPEHLSLPGLCRDCAQLSGSSQKSKS